MSKKSSKKSRKKTGSKKAIPRFSVPDITRPVAKMKKSDYIRTFPQDVPAKDVVAKGAKEGYDLTVEAVYQVRLGDRKKAKRAAQLGIAGQAGMSSDPPLPQLKDISTHLNGSASPAIQAINTIAAILSKFDSPTAQRILTTVSNLAQLA